MLDLPRPVIAERLAARLAAHEAASGAPVTVGQLFGEWQLQGVPQYAACCVAHWAAGWRPLRLMFHVPSVAEVLAMQLAGRRCVSAFVRREQLARRIDGRDAFDCAFHDLKHMENFAGGDAFAEQAGPTRQRFTDSCCRQ